jgi:predicted nuclease of predicted toxin-antitoxin system
MKFLCDVHISYKLISFFKSNGIEAIHVNSILNGSNSKDSEIADFADKDDLILISKDADFKLSYLLKKKPKKLIKVNLGNVSNEELLRIIERNLELIRVMDSRPSFMIELGKEPQIYL